MERPNTNERVAVAVFVKTPGLSPVKTRLAKTVGQEIASSLYQICCAATFEVLENVRKTDSKVDSYWSVAEKAGLSSSAWRLWPCLWQGNSSGLGARLDRVYRQLIGEYEKVILIGSDAPQISREILAAAISQLDHSDYVIGPARDGGFYLFGGRKEVRAEVWNSVPYSTAVTATELRKALGVSVSHAGLPELCDLDAGVDLPLVIEELQFLPARLPMQEALFLQLNSALAANHNQTL